MKKMINDYVVHECSHYQTCRDLWKGQDDGTKTYPLFSCKDCVGYECYVRGYIDASRPQGEWITFPTNHSIIQCPECTALLNNLRVDIFKDKIGKMNFCPNCGADMRKEADNETN